MRVRTRLPDEFRHVCRTSSDTQDKNQTNNKQSKLTESGGDNERQDEARRVIGGHLSANEIGNDQSIDQTKRPNKHDRNERALDGTNAALDAALVASFGSTRSPLIHRIMRTLVAVAQVLVVVVVVLSFLPPSRTKTSRGKKSQNKRSEPQKK